MRTPAWSGRSIRWLWLSLGIGQALASGIWAADAILAWADAGAPTHAGGPGAVTDRYRRQVDRELVADHRFADLLGRGLSSTRGADLAIGIAGLTPWTRRNFARWLFEDYPRALVLTPSRWRSHSFRGAGAYT